MITTSFQAMGTSWWVEVNASSGSASPHDDSERRHALVAAEALVRDLEAKLSRFRPDSSLSQLNTTRAVTCPTLAAITRLALGLQDATAGAFDPTLGAELVALGYDRSFEQIRRSPRPAVLPMTRSRSPTRVSVDGDHVRLDGPGTLDLGGIAKGYAVDRVLDLLLARGATVALVDGGGDLRGAGHAIPVGVGADLVIDTHAGAIATSSTLKRRWPASQPLPGHLDRSYFKSNNFYSDHYFHHIIDPLTGLPSLSSVVMATVLAPDTATADALATALIVNPEAVLTRLAALSAHALVRDREGRWWMSPEAPFVAPHTTLASRSPRKTPHPNRNRMRRTR